MQREREQRELEVHPEEFVMFRVKSGKSGKRRRQKEGGEGG